METKYKWVEIKEKLEEHNKKWRTDRKLKGGER